MHLPTSLTRSRVRREELDGLISTYLQIPSERPVQYNLQNTRAVPAGLCPTEGDMSQRNRETANGQQSPETHPAKDRPLWSCYHLHSRNMLHKFRRYFKQTKMITKQTYNTQDTKQLPEIGHSDNRVTVSYSICEKRLHPQQKPCKSHVCSHRIAQYHILSLKCNTSTSDVA